MANGDSVENLGKRCQRLAQWARADEGRKGRTLVLLVLVAYFPAFFGGFVGDDWIFLSEPLVRRLDGIVSIWFTPSEIKYESHYWPLVYTSFWIEHKLWGFHPAGYHAVNIVLHAFNSLLVWRLLLRLKVSGAWLVAAVFAVHPVHVESVAWIIERKDLLSALFYLGAVHAWLRFTEKSVPGRYVLCVLLLSSALLSKSIAVTLPAALLLLQWWRDGRVAWRCIGYILPLIAVTVAVTVADLAFYRDRVDSTFDYTWVERALIAARALWTYVWQLLAPVHLPILYPRWEVHPDDLVGWLALGGAVAVGAGLWLARDWIGRGPFVGAFFFVLTLSPVLGFLDFEFMGVAFVADRFQYLASIGPMAAVLALGVDVSSRMPPTRRAGAIVVGVVILVALSTITWRQSGIYRDRLTYARHTATLSPRHHLGQMLLSYALSTEDPEGALNAARRAVNLAEGSRGVNPAPAFLAMAQVLLKQDHSEEAEAVLRRALALSSRHQRAHIQLALARTLVNQTRYDEGLALYGEILAEDPGNDLAHLYKGRTFFKSGRYDHAASSFNKALAVVRHPDTEPELHVLLGETLRKLLRFHVATAHLDKALALNPNDVRTLVARHDLEVDRQRGDGLSVHGGEPRTGGTSAWLAAARERCREVIAKKPEHALARVLLGAVLLRMREYGPAATVIREALALTRSRPVAREAHRILGEVREKQGRSEDAVRHYQGALNIYPFDAEALRRLAALRFRQNSYLAALPLHLQLVKVTPFVAEAHLQLGMTLYHLDRHSDALPAVERALKLAPGLEPARRLQQRIHETENLPPLSPDRNRKASRE